MANRRMFFHVRGADSRDILCPALTEVNDRRTSLPEMIVGLSPLADATIRCGNVVFNHLTVTYSKLTFFIF